MRERWIRAACVVAVLACLGTTAQAKDAPPDFVPGEVLVKFNPSTDRSAANAALSSVGASVVSRFQMSGVVHVRVPGDVLFSAGALLLAWFVFRLWVSPRKKRAVRAPSPSSSAPRENARDESSSRRTTAVSSTAIIPTWPRCPRSICCGEKPSRGGGSPVFGPPTPAWRSDS